MNEHEQDGQQEESVGRHPEIDRVFEDEAAFLAAQDKFHRSNRGFVVSKGTKQFWVYAVNKDIAMGLVARRLKLLDAATYERARTIRTLPENEVMAIFNSLTPDLQAKVRRHLAKTKKS